MTEFSRPNADGKPYILAMDDVTCSEPECLVIHCKTTVGGDSESRVFAIHIHPEYTPEALVGRPLVNEAMDRLLDEMIRRAIVVADAKKGAAQ